MVHGTQKLPLHKDRLWGQLKQGTLGLTSLVQPLGTSVLPMPLLPSEAAAALTSKLHLPLFRKVHLLFLDFLPPFLLIEKSQLWGSRGNHLISSLNPVPETSLFPYLEEASA